jgi:hypothetical protein
MNATENDSDISFAEMLDFMIQGDVSWDFDGLLELDGNETYHSIEDVLNGMSCGEIPINSDLIERLTQCAYVELEEKPKSLAEDQYDNYLKPNDSTYFETCHYAKILNRIELAMKCGHRSITLPPTITGSFRDNICKALKTDGFKLYAEPIHDSPSSILVYVYFNEEDIKQDLEEGILLKEDLEVEA